MSDHHGVNVTEAYWRSLSQVFEPSFDLSEYTFPGGPKAKLVQGSGSAPAPTSTSGGSESASPGVTSVPDTATVGTDAPVSSDNHDPLPTTTL